MTAELDSENLFTSGASGKGEKNRFFLKKISLEREPVLLRELPMEGEKLKKYKNELLSEREPVLFRELPVHCSTARTLFSQKKYSQKSVP
jgi:hypothetical protein